MGTRYQSQEQRGHQKITFDVSEIWEGKGYLEDYTSAGGDFADLAESEPAQNF
jgi:hypothetical protein